MLELYFILMKNHLGNHKECKALIKHEKIKVNNKIETNPKRYISENDVIEYDGRVLKSQPFTYIMLHKPAGYICANKDDHYRCVVDLINNKDVFCLGRLDIDTTGLLILSDDVRMKKLLMPEYHIEKTYLVETLKPIKQEDVEHCFEGIVIDGNVRCKSARMEILDEKHCYVSISEGKYHQIKKMFLSLNNEVVHLHRKKFAGLLLDDSLQPGRSRILNEGERTHLLKVLSYLNKQKKV